MPEGTFHPRAPFWLRVTLAVLVFVIGSSSPLLGFLLPGVRNDFFHGSAESHMTVALFVWPIALITYVALSGALIRFVDRQKFRALGLAVNLRALGALGAGVGVAVLIALAVLALSKIVDTTGVAPPSSPVGDMGDVNALAGVPLWLIVLYLLFRAFVLQGIGEEVVMRGYLLQSLRTCPKKAVLVSAVAFMLPHLLSSGGQRFWWEYLTYLAIPFGFALSAGYLAIALRSVWAAIGVHGGFHVGMFVAAAFGLSQLEPWMHLVFGIGHALVGFAVARRISPARWAEVATVGPYGGRTDA